MVKLAQVSKDRRVLALTALFSEEDILRERNPVPLEIFFDLK